MGHLVCQAPVSVSDSICHIGVIHLLDHSLDLCERTLDSSKARLLVIQGCAPEVPLYFVHVLVHRISRPIEEVYGTMFGEISPERQ